MNDLDKLLAELKGEFTQSNSSDPTSLPLKEMLQNVKKEVELQKPLNANSAQKSAQKSPNTGSDNEPMVEQLKRELLADEQARQKQLLELQEAQKQQQRQAYEAKAKEWLKKLNPDSPEGLWFEEFSYAYESKLAAAIDYIQALEP